MQAENKTVQPNSFFFLIFFDSLTHYNNETIQYEARTNLTTFYYTFYIMPYNLMDFMIRNRPKMVCLSMKYTLVFIVYTFRTKVKNTTFY